MRNTKKVWLLAIRADLPNSDKDTGDPSRGLKLLAMEKKQELIITSSPGFHLKPRENLTGN